MEAEVRQLATYGGACDELLEWLSDVRAYNPYNEKALLGCINAIYEKASEYGAWSGLEILKEANQKCGNGLSDKGRACIKKCYEDLHNSVTGRRPSNASIVSTASASHPSPASLTSNRSVAHVNIPGSPTANNSYSQLVKILDASVFPQSPNSNIGSPLSSPQFRGADVSALQTTPNQAHRLRKQRNTSINNNSSNSNNNSNSNSNNTYRKSCNNSV
ncbi:hypothetical protein G6F42_026108 [Rhizopus arrhizus]|nr:hypothetical protein G6F42_026108 [Rhizopus arrhizus]